MGEQKTRYDVAPKEPGFGLTTAVKPTPMLRQYLHCKQQYPDCILFFRLGDFYEMFFEDAETASRLLGIALTSRAKGKGGYPMCGVPYFSANSYIAKLVKQGHKVAVCDQVEDASQAKGIVKREVTRVVSPGMITDPEDLDARQSNYLAGVVLETPDLEPAIGFAFIDVSTADFRMTQVSSEQMLIDELARVSPKELLMLEHLEGSRLVSEIQKYFKSLYIRFTSFKEKKSTSPSDTPGWMSDFQEAGCQTQAHQELGFKAAVMIFNYAHISLPESLDHIRRLVNYQASDHMIIDDCSRTNLELVSSLTDGRRKGSLLGLLDRAKTPMGARMLAQWLMFPLVSPSQIELRLNAVEWLVNQGLLRADLTKHLSHIRDLERLVAKTSLKTSLGQATPRDIAALRDSIRMLPKWVDLIGAGEELPLSPLLGSLDPLDDLYRKLNAALVDDPSADLSEGGAIRPGFDPNLDELIDLATRGREYIARLEEQERSKTGIGSLKVRYNRVFGYYIEVTKPHLKQVPHHYRRKQTTANAERFETDELKEQEESILRAHDNRVSLERSIISELTNQIRSEAQRILAVAKQVATTDVISTFAELASSFGYSRPRVDDSEVIDIEDGRHPVVERSLASERFVPNDIKLDCNSDQLLIITGPNMAGKSTTIRQVALITIMAQMGSFVPAASCLIGVVDRIFTRIGASDSLARGQSTFMMEMLETAHILRHATRRSLLILDEIGRGTSTFDGLSIAWATAEYIHDRIMSRTLFATHYHQLTDLVSTKQRVVNYSMSVKEWKNQIVFLRRLIKGICSRSYGIQVGRLAGLPEEVIQRAQEILNNLEREECDELGSPKLSHSSGSNERSIGQLQLFNTGSRSPVELELDELDIDTITPLEALQLLCRLKRGL